jgi:hypothetical protein
MLVKIEQPAKIVKEGSVFGGLRAAAPRLLPPCSGLSFPAVTHSPPTGVNAIIFQNIFKDCGVFFEPRERPSVSHVYHAIHHNFTIEIPRSAPHFS